MIRQAAYVAGGLAAVVLLGKLIIAALIFVMLLRFLIALPGMTVELWRRYVIGGPQPMRGL